MLKIKMNVNMITYQWNEKVVITGIRILENKAL
jgi:hypothetical protein